MNEGLQNLMQSVGVLCEFWILAYTKFCEMGCSVEEARLHTAEFIKTLIASKA